MVHGGGLEVAVAVVEVAGEALKRHHAHSAVVVEHKQMLQAAENELVSQQEENRRLHALLGEYQKAMERMQKQGRGMGEGLGQPGFLDTNVGPSPPNPNSTGRAGPHDLRLYEWLKEKVDSPEFLEKLKGGSEWPNSPERVVVNVPDDPSLWLGMTDQDMIESDAKIEQDKLGSDGYLIITHDDIVDGIASFMARHISSMPQTKGMTPQQLQKAISQAFTDLERQGKLRMLWNCGKFMYSAASWGATAVGLYKNPIIVQAAMMAVWTSCSVVVSLLT